MSNDNIKDLLDLMVKLRDKKDGCPWDIKQDFNTIAAYTIEEAYEVADSIARKDFIGLKEELGDLLFQVVFHSQIAKEQELFNFSSVVDSVYHKMISRHPHIFASSNNKEEIKTASDQEKAWERYKEEERKKNPNISDSILSNIPINLPAIKRAYKLQQRAANVGFDWPDVEDTMLKFDEEVNELKQAIKDNSNIKEELGDVMFALVNIARKLKIDPETALMETNNKFSKRFAYIETKLKDDGKNIKDSNLKQMNELWNKAKSL